MCAFLIAAFLTASTVHTVADDVEHDAVKVVKEATNYNKSVVGNFECDVVISMYDNRPPKQKLDITSLTDEEKRKVHVVIERRPYTKFVGHLSVTGDAFIWNQEDENGNLLEILSFNGRQWRRYNPKHKVLSLLNVGGLGGKCTVDIRNFGRDLVSESLQSLLDGSKWSLAKFNDGMQGALLKGICELNEPVEITFDSNFLPTEIRYGHGDGFERRFIMSYKPFAKGFVLDEGIVEYHTPELGLAQKMVYKCTDYRIIKPLESIDFENIVPVGLDFRTVDLTSDHAAVSAAPTESDSFFPLWIVGAFLSLLMVCVLFRFKFFVKIRN